MHKRTLLIISILLLIPVSIIIFNSETNRYELKNTKNQFIPNIIKITKDPINPEIDYNGPYINYKNGTPLPINGLEGIYKIEISVENLELLDIPTLYFGPSPYPAKIYFNNVQIFKWGDSLDSFRMQTVRPFAVPLMYDKKGITNGVISILFYTDGQKIAFPKFFIGTKKDVSYYVFIQSLVSFTGISALVLLSYLLSLIMILYFFITNKKYKVILFVGLFALSDALGYTIFVFDSAAIPQLPLLKLSRSFFPIAMCFLFSSHINLINIKSQKILILEKIFYILAIIGSITIFFSTTIYHVTIIFNVTSVLVMYPISIIISALILINTIKKKGSNSLILLGIFMVLITESIDVYNVLTLNTPYAWISAYGQFTYLFLVIIHLITIEEKFHINLKKLNIELNATLDNLKLTQNELVESEKMSALGEMVSGISHEINTPLGIAVTSASFLQDETNSLIASISEKGISKNKFNNYIEVVPEISTLILTNLTKALNMIQSFKNVAVDQHSQSIKEFDLATKINEILVSTSPRFKHTNFKTEVICKQGIMMNSIPGAISQILTNLLLNSLIHGFEGLNEGVIKITVKEEEQNIIMTYTDSGKGIPKENLDKISLPFFTTKKGSGGSGLGMHIIYNLVTKNLKGTIICGNAPNKGAMFIIEIPKKLNTNL